MKFKINYKLLPIKAHFFLVFSALAPLLPFIPVYAKQLGFDAFGVGIIFAVLPIMGMIAKPISGWLADHFSKQKFVFLFSLVLTGVGYFSLQLISGLEADNTSQLMCSNPQSILKICRSKEAWSSLLPLLPKDCPVNCTLSCTLTYQPLVCSGFSIPDCKEDGLIHFSISSNLSHHDTQTVPGCLFLPVDLANTATSSRTQPICQTRTTVNDCQANCEDENIRKFVRKDWWFESPTFWIFFLLNIISYSAFSVATSMGDALCFELLEGKHQDYGVQRVWGSVGWGIFTIISGALVDSQSTSETKDYTAAFLLMGGLLVLDFLISFKMKLNTTVKATSVFKDMWLLLSTPSVLVFVVWCTAVGTLTSIVWQWLLWFLQDLAIAQHRDLNSCTDRGGPEWVNLLLGLNMGVQCFVGEVPMFFWSGWIIKKLGHGNTMTLVLGAFGARFILYSCITNPWYSLPIEILNGITFGIFYATMTSYAHIISPPGFESTMQGIVGAAFEGLGVAIGSFVGGAVYKAKGGVFLFRAFGLFSIVLCVLHALVNIALKKFVKQGGEKVPGFNEVPTVDTDRHLNGGVGALVSGGQGLLTDI